MDYYKRMSKRIEEFIMYVYVIGIIKINALHENIQNWINKNK